jgi:transcriptional regulator with XRE-family HTH domain
MDRREFLSQFRERLQQVIGASDMSRSAFAQSVGMDRSTLSQLLSPANDRLPRVDTLAAIAAARQVSIDWLLGLSQTGHLGADIMREQLSIERDALSAADARLIRWHTEAIGYKIRYVPSTLPDLLKSEDVIRYELAHFATTSPEQAIETAAARLAYQRRPETDMEACNSLQELEGFARGEGIWRALDTATRISQVDYMIALLEELYPTFRWFLYDGRQRYSVPVTIFGPLRATIYIGQMYFVFNSTEHIRTLTQHFDGLIRSAVLQPPDVADYLRELRNGMLRGPSVQASRLR